MSTVSINDEVLIRAGACKPLVEFVTDTELSHEEMVEFLLALALDKLLADVLAAVDQPTLVRAFQLLAMRYTKEIYSFTAEMLQSGAAPVDKRTFR